MSILAFERHFSAKQIAEMWGLDETTVRRMFADVPGVLKIGTEHRPGRRGYVSLRIPESVVVRVHGERERAR